MVAQALKALEEFVDKEANTQTGRDFSKITQLSPAK